MIRRVGSRTRSGVRETRGNSAASSSVLRLTTEQRQLLSAADASLLRKKRRARELDHHDDKVEQRGVKRRFQFHTLRYRYPGMARISAGASLTGFVNEAERRIVDFLGGEIQSLAMGRRNENVERRKEKGERRGLSTTRAR